MEKKQYNRSIAAAAILLALVLAFLGLLIWEQSYGWRVQRRLERARVELQSTAAHSQADLDAAVEAVKRDMPGQWAFDLERIWYDPAQAGPLERDVKSQYGILQPEDVVVLFVDYRDMAYRYALVRNDGSWGVFSALPLHGSDTVFVTPTPTPIG